MNKKRLNESHNSREYNILLKGSEVYCPICNRRAGVFNAYCGPKSEKVFKNWKQFRKTKWK